MDDIIAAIANDTDIEKQVGSFLALPKKEKLSLLEKARNIRSETFGRFLNAAHELEEDKEVLKAIRRMLFLLRSAGIKVEEPRAQGASVLRKIEEVHEHKGFFSNYDDSETRIILLVFGIRKNSFVFINAVSHFSKGLIELTTAPVDRQNRDMIIGEYQRGTSEHIVFTEISPRYASFLIEEASARSGKFTDEIRQMKQLNERMTGGVQGTDDIYRLAIPGDTESLSAERIFSHPIFAPLKITWENAGSDRKEYAGIGASTIVLPQYMAEEKRREFIKALVEREPLKSYVLFMKRLLEDYAYLFHTMGVFPYYKGIVELLGNVGFPGEALSAFVKRSLETTIEKPSEGIIVDPYGTVRP